MDFARIKRASGPIGDDEWLAVVKSNPSLEPIPDRTGVNPFTREPVVFPGTGKAYFMLAGERVGNAALEHGEILTTGIPQAACEAIAQSLNARVFEDNRS